VCPFDPISPKDKLSEDILRASQVAVINAKFGEFIESLLEVVERPIAINKRDSILVPVQNSYFEIDPNDFEKDKQQFFILNRQIEAEIAPSISESLNGYENWGSFLSHHFIDRFCKGEFLELLEKPSSGSSELIVLSASAGWGKTFLLRDIAIHYYKKGRPVIWLNSYSTIEIPTTNGKSVVTSRWDVERITNLLKTLDELADEEQYGKICPLIIADNCPERVLEVASLFINLSRDKRNFILVFSIRDNDLDELNEESPLFEKATKFRPAGTYESSEEVRRLIDFCAENDVASFENIREKEVVAQNIISEEADKELILALQVIFDKEHRPFSEIVKDFWRTLPDEISMALVLRVAVLHRYGSLFSPRLYSLIKTFEAYMQSDVLNHYNDVIHSSVLFERMEEDEPCVYTLHSLVAERMVKVTGLSDEDVDDALLHILSCMSGNIRDLEIIRRLIKRTADYDVSLSTPDQTDSLFRIASRVTNYDYVICQQYARYLTQNEEFAQAVAWIDRAISNNPNYSPLYHTKGNILRRWGMALWGEEKFEEARTKFEEASELFVSSRAKRYQDEYSYTTHLDMLMFLVDRERNKYNKANYRAEGIMLYEDAIRTVPQDRYNWLLDEKYSQHFDFDGALTERLCLDIAEAIENGLCNGIAATFLAQHLYNSKKYKESIEVLQKFRAFGNTGSRVWVKEAELHAREGHYDKARKAIEGAKRAEVENEEVSMQLSYWDLLLAIVRQDYATARQAMHRISEKQGDARASFPKGYIWLDKARRVKPNDRNFKEHAKIWSGRVESVKSNGRFGRIILTNAVGEQLGISFNPNYFTRSDFRRGEPIQFVLTLLADGIRADDINTTPFRNTVDDLFVKV
jgi:tetratricopeptide (TPR) repeat protein